MHLADLQIIRPIAAETSRLGTIVGRVSRLARLYAMIAVCGAVLAGIVALAGWRIITGIGIGIVLSALVAYAIIRTFPVLHILAAWFERGEATVVGEPVERPETKPMEELPLGTMLAGRYRLSSILGRSSIGVIYKADDRHLDETVSVATLTPPRYAQQNTLEEFKYAIQTSRKVTHRNVMRTYDYGESDGVYFIATEFILGYSLLELVQEAPQGQMPVQAVIGIARQIARGLRAIHEHGLIFGDLRPETVMIDAKGEVKLASFSGMAIAGPMYDDQGMAKYAGPARAQEYREHDARSDIYSFGALLYQMLVGRPMFDVRTCRPLTASPEPPIELRPEIGPELNAIILRCLMSHPAERYQDAAALLADLERLGTQEGAEQIA